MGNDGYWQDGYWHGKMIDGYPASYFSSGKFEYPWEKSYKNNLDIPKQSAIVMGNEGNKEELKGE